MRVEILERNDPMVRYGVYDGSVMLKQVHRDCSAEMAEAKQRRKSLQTILEAKEAVS